MSEYETIEIDASPGGVAVILLNRPEKRNAFNRLMIDELADAFETLEDQDHLRMVILRGAGDVFCAGADLDWMRNAAEFTQSENEEDAYALAEMLRRLHNLPQMTVASVHGAAMGGGAGLVAACDIAVARKDTSFRFSEVRLGLTPATISPFVIEAIGPRWAKALFVTGEGFDAPYAEKMGLVQYVVETADEMSEMLEYLSGLAFQNAPGAVADAKKLVDDVVGKEIDHDLCHMTAHRIAARRASEEGQEGVNAFLEKRKPSWADDN
ncbi:MAG: enoyl-CoA hydratase [Ponticaulis sp.]|nr:enoyl-CoA hydratase [Ponticaulis sp.]|tara:strand:+ start:2231 stop:3031 length:801 start_codon:yes stop_codon:yes gene_type:complete